MQIIDAQIHGVGPWGDWTKDSADVQHRLMAETVVAYLDAVGVHGAVLFTDAEEGAWTSAALPDRFTYVPIIRRDTADADAAVRAAKDSKGLVGLRVLLGWPTDGSEVKHYEAGAYNPIFAACEQYQVPLFLFATRALHCAGEIAAKYPRLTLIVDHIGLRQPPLDECDDPPFRLLPELLALAKFPNVHVKLCGLPSMSREAYPYADVAPHLRKIVDAFGANRLMWASDTTRFIGRIGIGRFQHPKVRGDYPGKHTYAEALYFVLHSPVLTAEEKREILGGTARRVLRWAV